MNPLWNQLVVGGFSEGSPYLGFVDMIGTSFEEDFIATGFGGYLALPIIRSRCRFSIFFLSLNFNSCLSIYYFLIYVHHRLIYGRWRADLTEAEAKTLLEDCLRVCFYRDCRSSSRIIVAKATAEGMKYSFFLSFFSPLITTSSVHPSKRHRHL